MRYRSVALPPEHGGWGLLFEPILIGLVAAPSASGALIACAAVAVFLARQPLKVVLIDRAAGRRVPRTRHAVWFATGYVAIATLAGGAALGITGAALLVPVAWAAPLAAVQLAYDARNRSRGLLPELCGAAALAVTSSAIAIAGEWGLASAMALWAVTAARTLPAMVTVRTQVRRLRTARTDVRADEERAQSAGRPDEERAGPDGQSSQEGAPPAGRADESATAPLVTHALGMGTVYALQAVGLVPRGVVTVLAVLAARAGFTLRASAPRVRPQRIGIEELVIGLLVAALLGWLCRR